LRKSIVRPWKSIARGCADVRSTGRPWLLLHVDLDDLEPVTRPSASSFRTSVEVTPIEHSRREVEEDRRAVSLAVDVEPRKVRAVG
jgi:hypothetical protein